MAQLPIPTKKIRVRFMEIKQPRMLKLVYRFYQRGTAQRRTPDMNDKHIIFDVGDGTQFIETDSQMFYFQCSDVWTPTPPNDDDPADDIIITDLEYFNMFRNAYIAGFIEAAINTLKKPVTVCGRGDKVILKPIGYRHCHRPKERHLQSDPFPLIVVPRPLNTHRFDAERSKTPKPARINTSTQNVPNMRLTSNEMNFEIQPRGRLLSYRTRSHLTVPMMVPNERSHSI